MEDITRIKATLLTWEDGGSTYRLDYTGEKSTEGIFPCSFDLFRREKDTDGTSYWNHIQSYFFNKDHFGYPHKWEHFLADAFSRLLVTKGLIEDSKR